jgi:hypothetical protein
MRFSDHMLPGGSLEWSVFQCPVCKLNITGYAAFAEHTDAKTCKEIQPKVKVRRDSPSASKENA